jgi:hypothetical protein
MLPNTKTTTNYPRILIISEDPFCLSRGIGVTLRTLFQGWPKDRLFQFFSLVYSDQPCRDICDSIVHIDLARGRRYMLPFLLGMIPVCNSRYSRAWLRRLLGAWHPQIIYSMSFSKTLLSFAGWVARELSCPHILHITDDTYNPLSNENSRQILAEAKVRIAISQEMQMEYQNRYGFDFHVLHNGAADELFLPQPNYIPSEDTLVIRYLGGLDRHMHFNAIEDIAEAVKIFNHSGGSAVFEIYGGEWSKNLALSLLSSNEVVYKGYVGRAEGYELLKTSDLLVIPVSFANSTLSKIRLSFPTKLPEYLASGTLTLVYGPPNVASVRYCIQHKVGLTQTKRSIQDLVKIFTKLKNEPNSFQEKALNDRNFAKKHLSASIIREQFHQILKKALAL